MKLGAGLDTTAQINPLVSAHHRDKVVQHIEGARAGLTFLAGGTPADDLPGYYVKPAVIADPHPDSAIVRDEVFGPVIVVVPFDDAADAVRLANASPYGLAASLWSNDLTRVMNLVPQIEAGTVWVNCHIPLDPSMPFGGYKHRASAANSASTRSKASPKPNPSASRTDARPQPQPIRQWRLQ